MSFYLLTLELINDYIKKINYLYFCFQADDKWKLFIWLFYDVWCKLATTDINPIGGTLWDVFWMKMVWDEFGIKLLNFYHNFTMLQPNSSPERFTMSASEWKHKKYHEIWLKLQYQCFSYLKPRKPLKNMYLWISSQSQSSMHHHMTWHKLWGW